jgi:hypothetical protein
MNKHLSRPLYLAVVSLLRRYLMLAPGATGMPQSFTSDAEHLLKQLEGL